MEEHRPAFETNVFINCPFDDDYTALLRPLLFTIVYLEYTPRIASERFDSGEARIQKICELIQVSKFSIHDLSRIQATRTNELYRLNMPFELGIDIGCRLFAPGEAQTKKCLILEQERFRYQRALSDLSGSDIKTHNNNPEELVRVVRNWFVEVEVLHAPSGTRIWEHFNEFMADFYMQRQAEGYRDRDLDIMPIPEYIAFMQEWLEEKGIRSKP
jgi:hypothetical protein